MKCRPLASSLLVLLCLACSALAESAPEPLGPSTRRSGLVISEIMYHPAPRADGKNLEFIELYNAQEVFEDLSGYRLSGAVDFTFPAGTVLRSGEFLVVARVPADLQSAYGITNVIGAYPKGLDNKSGTLRLRHRTGAILSEARYSSNPPWPIAADGAGHSLVLAHPSSGATDPQSWAASDRMGGSPGRLERPKAEPLQDVVINEVLTHDTAEQAGFVELYNHTSQAVDLSGAILTDDAAVAEYIIPAGTVLPAAGFLSISQADLGFKSLASGGTIFLVNSTRTKVIDAVRFDAQAPGTAWGRTPDGADRLNPLDHPTLGAANGARLRGEIVLNEIMYHPLSGLSDDQYVELFNRSANAVPVGGWKLTQGIDFTIPGNTVIPAGGYLVVAKNASRLLTNYSNLNAANTVGDFKGSLGKRGERLVLTRPDPVLPGNDVVVDDVTPGAGGRWGQWSDGGGSSLELTDPASDNQLPSNWADSDESGKAPWTAIEVTGVLDNGTGSADELQMFMQGPGECLVDDVQVISAAGVNLIPNSTFESDASGWVAEGTQEFSSLETTEGYQSTHSFHIRAVERGDDQVNRVRIRLTTALTTGQTATIRAKVRWLRGFPSMLFRLRGNYLEAIGAMTIPASLGTPGAPNSRAVANAGPAIYEVSHSPILPAAGQPAVVTARAADPDGLSQLLLQYRIDPGTTVTSVTMVDDGTGGDEIAGDGIFSASIPGQPSGTLVAFSVRATDAANPGVPSTFPNDAPVRECLIRFGETQPAGTLGTYRLWMTQATFNRWSSRSKMSNTPLDVTFVYNNTRAIYNTRALFAGSPYISPGYTTPSGALCGYTIIMPDDDRFLGDTDVVLDWPGRDNTAVEEQLTYWIAGQMNLPYNYRRFIHLHVNGVNEQQRGSVYEDVQQPGSEIVKEWVPDDTNGDFYKIERWFEFNDAGQKIADPEPTLQNFTTTGGVKKLARYRWNWLKRATPSVNDYTNIFRLVDAVNAPAPEPYTTQTETLADIEEWMRIFAVEHMVDNFDSYGHLIGKNMYAYKPENGKWLLFMFDIDWVMKESASYGNQTTSAPLFDVNDPTIGRMYNHPPFRRAYFRAVQDAVNGPMLNANIDPVMDAKSAALFANGVTRSAGQTLVGPAAVKQWIAARRAYLVQQLATVAAPFSADLGGSSDLTTDTSPVTISGTAPVEVAAIQINGVSFPVTWTTVNNWSIRYALQPGDNLLAVQAFDLRGNPLPDATANLHVQFTGTDPTAGVQVRINEWMASNTQTLPDPFDGQFEDWFELFNAGPAPVDLSDFTLTDDLADPRRFIVPTGTIIDAGAYLLVWADGHPEANPSVDLHVPFKLAQAGEQLGLSAPNGRLVDSVTFGPQISDVAQGRWPDGGTLITVLGQPTPKAPNQVTAQPGDIRIMTAQVSLSGTLALTWTAEPGQAYEIQASSNLVNWTTISVSPIPAVGPVDSYTVSMNSGAAEFYRVVISAR